MSDSLPDKSWLYEFAEAQSGYFTARQALQAGYSYRQQHYQRTTGLWQPADRGVFRLRDFPPSEYEHLVRWSLWSRNQKGIPQGVVSHDTALAVHGLSDLMPSRVHLTVPPGFRKRVPSALVLHRGSLAPDEVEQRPGFRLTTPLRTLLDTAQSPLAQEHLDAAVTQALQRGLVRRPALASAPCAPLARARLDRALTSAARETERDRPL